MKRRNLLGVVIATVLLTSCGNNEEDLNNIIPVGEKLDIEMNKNMSSREEELTKIREIKDSLIENKYGTCEVESSCLFDVNKDGTPEICYVGDEGNAHYYAAIYDQVAKKDIFSSIADDNIRYSFDIRDGELVLLKLTYRKDINVNRGIGKISVNDSNECSIKWSNVFKISDYSLSLKEQNKEMSKIDLVEKDGVYYAAVNSFAIYELDLTVDTKVPELLNETNLALEVKNSDGLFFIRNTYCSVKENVIKVHLILKDTHFKSKTVNFNNKDYDSSLSLTIEFSGFTKKVVLANKGISPNTKKLKDVINLPQETTASSISEVDYTYVFGSQTARSENYSDLEDITPYYNFLEKYVYLCSNDAFDVYANFGPMVETYRYKLNNGNEYTLVFNHVYFYVDQFGNQYYKFVTGSSNPAPTDEIYYAN